MSAVLVGGARATVDRFAGSNRATSVVVTESLVGVVPSSVRLHSHIGHTSSVCLAILRLLATIPLSV